MAAANIVRGGNMTLDNKHFRNAGKTEFNFQEKKQAIVSTVNMIMEKCGVAPLNIMEKATLEQRITELYASHGINEDPESIYDSKGMLKSGPSINDLEQFIREDQQLERVHKCLVFILAD